MHIDELDERQSWIKRAKMGDTEAVQNLLTMHLPLIRMLAGRICVSYIERDVLIQAGSIGLMQALRHYQSAKDVKLTTYALPWILGEMKKALCSEVSHCISLEEEAQSDGTNLLQRLCGEDGIDVTTLDLRIGIEKLSEELRMVICLRYFRDRTQIETARLLKKSQAQISRLERQALDALHACLI